MGRLRNYNDHIWNGIRWYMRLIAKFSQNEELKKQLKGTKTAILAECAVKDRISGIHYLLKIGFDITSGSNLLGYALMEVRKRL